MKALLTLFAALVSSCMMAQAPAEWQDGLVNHLAGSWKLEGKVMGSNAHHDVQADWVLNHQFLRIQEKTAANAPATERPGSNQAFRGLGNGASELFAVCIPTSTVCS
jgi:hypothetical protein